MENLARARRALQGVGDSDIGEWMEMGRVAMHLRRRLSAVEQAESGLVMSDIRGTPEAERRLAVVRDRLPPGYVE
jgi:hypothetical protein